jgi:hypothetical protein
MTAIFKKYRLRSTVVVSASVVACLGSTMSFAQPADDLTFNLGPEINVGQSLETPPYNQYQTNLRTDPNDPDQMVITAKNGAEDHTVAFHTDDGGATWDPTREQRSSDPDVVYDNRGNAYWTFIDTSADSANAVRRSLDGGKTWRPAQPLINNGGVDHPHVIADRSEASPYTGSIYFAGRTFGGSRLKVVRSRDTGATWQRSTLDLPSKIGDGFVHQTAVMNDGTLVIPIESESEILVENGRFAGSKRNLYAVTSSDGGRTFSEPVFLGNKDTPKNPGPGSYRANSGVATGPANGQERLYFVYPKPRSNEPSVLKLVTSDDQGQTWRDPRTIVPPTPAGRGVGAPSVMVNDKGIIGVSFYSSSDDSGPFDLYFTASADGGETFAEPTRISSVSSAIPALGTQPREPGADQVYGDVAADGTFKLVWTDNRDGDNTYTTYHRSVRVVPEPGTAVILGLGTLAGCASSRRRRCTKGNA